MCRNKLWYSFAGMNEPDASDTQEAPIRCLKITVNNITHTIQGLFHFRQ